MWNYCMWKEEPGNEATELRNRNTADHKREGGRRGVSLKQRERGGGEVR